MVMVSIVDAVNRVALGRGPGFALFILRPIKQIRKWITTNDFWRCVAPTGVIV